MAYKASRYNIMAEYEGKSLLFNGLTGALLELDEAKRNQWDRYLNKEIELKTENPQFFEGLLQSRCLVNSETDELKYVSDRSRSSVYGDRTYRLTINPTMNCNFKCWYCYEGHVKSKMTAGVQERVYSHVQHLIQTGEICALELGWFGGEPLMPFSTVVYPLSKRLKQLCESANIPFSNSITTNAYLIHEKAVAQYEEIGLRSFQITLDGNRERHNQIRFLKGNKKGTYDRIVQNINLLIERMENVHINLRFNYEDKTLAHLDQVIDVFSAAYRHKIHVDFQRVWQTYESKDGNNANPDLKGLIDRYQKAGYTAGSGANEFTLYSGKKCYADKLYQAVVNYNGNIYKCTARDFTEANAEGYLDESGEIKWKPGRQDRRFHRAPWQRERCMDCHLLPLCMGPCSQAMIEVGEENRNKNCWLDNLELNVEDYVIDRYISFKSQQNMQEPLEV